MTSADLRAREAEDWFDPHGFLLAERDGQLLGSVWTKVHPAGEHGPDRVGEIYVVGVDPDAQGLGLGRALTALGLDHLSGAGLTAAILYTDAENTVAVHTYERAGFVRAGADVMFGSDTKSSPRDVTMGDMTDLTIIDPDARGPHRRARATGGRRSSVDDAELELEPLPDDRFLDRELSWLAFNQRVLELAEDPDVPLLERVRFLAIFASNLDEFFMVRVAGLKRRIATGIAVTAASGLSPRQVLEAISEEAHRLMARHAAVFAEQVQPELAGEGITLVRWDELGESEQDRLRKFFRRQIFPVLTPLAVDPAHPFPYISGLSLNLAVVVSNPSTGKEHFARVKVPPLLPRFIAVDASGRPSAPDVQAASLERGPMSFVPVEDVISEHLDQLFPGMVVQEHHSFRVTRNEDVEVEEDDAENLLKAMEKELLRRRFGPPVRLEIADGISPRIRSLLIRELGVDEDEVYELPAPLDHTGLHLIADLDRSSLQYPRFVASTPRQLAEVESATPADMFAKIRERDILLHHPYDSFSHERADVPAAGRGRPAGARDQADALPHVGRLPDRRRPDRRRRGRQAGPRAGRDQGAFRRAEQHLLGPQARAGGRPRGLRHRRPQDALQAVAGRASGGRRPAPLLPHRHRQLQPEDGAPLHRPRAAHQRPRGRPGPDAAVQPAVRATRRSRGSTGCSSRPARSATASSSASTARPRPRARAGRRGSRSRSTRWSTRPRSTPCTARRRPACRSIS